MTTTTAKPRESKLVQTIIDNHKDNIGELKMIIRMIEGWPNSNKDDVMLLPYYKSALKLIESK